MEVSVVTAVTSGYGYYRRMGDLEQSVPVNERRIPVTELLRREGYPLEPTVPPTRRALGGVAAGAVLAFGAVVGGLMAQHASAPANVGGNMADQPAPYQGADAAGQPPQGGGQSLVGAPLAGGKSATPGSPLSTTTVVSVAQVTSTATNQPSSDSAGTGAVRGGGSSVASTSAPSTTPNAPAPSSSSPTPPPSLQSSGTTTPKPSSPSPSSPTPPPSSSGGGVIGTVGGVLDGLLHPVTGLLGGL
jgi:hypothetical protein